MSEELHAMLRALRRHWPEYLMEAAGLGFILISACVLAMLLFHPDSPLVSRIDSLWMRRLLMGVGVGGAGMAVVYSPWGKQSGAHLNPAVTLAFFHLGKAPGWDALFYAVSQCAGGLLAVSLMAALFGRWLGHPAIHHLTTTPGEPGPAAAWIAEFAVCWLLMSLILAASNSPRLARCTGCFVAVLVAMQVSLIAPTFGTSTNPARTLAAAAPSGVWTAVWVYLTAPPLAMVIAARCCVWRKGPAAVFCAKLHPQNDRRCIFCETRAARSQEVAERCNRAAPPASKQESEAFP